MPSPPTRPRLDTVLAMVPPDVRAVADIGYDHGLLMLRLARERPALRLYGVEMLPDRADAMRQRHPAAVSALADRLTLLVGDGLAPLPAGAVDCVVIAGLSDRSLVAILERARATLPTLRRVILCPARVEATLRPALPGLGLRIVDERIAAEHRRTWDVIAVEPAEPADIPEPPDATSLFWGPLMVARRDLGLAYHLDHLAKVYAPAFTHHLNGHRLPDGSLTPLGQKLALLPALRARAATWPSAHID
ncbi:MAG: tRNA (adenine(22)-N(1))-methyltransferase TrmK [Myxococcota bacterium]